MKVSKSFMRAFAYIANYYEWSPATVDEVKQETRENPELIRYWQELADAHRAGYKQTKENNYQRLRDWQEKRIT